MKKLIESIKVICLGILLWIAWAIVCGGISISYNFFNQPAYVFTVEASFKAGAVIGLFTFFPLVVFLTSTMEDSMSDRGGIEDIGE